MKRFLVSILALAVLLAIGGGVYWAQARAYSGPYTATGPGDVYLAMGDSLAAGFVVSDPQEAYVARIGAALRARGPIEVRNVSVPGETSTSLIRRQLPQALRVIEQQRAAGKRVSPITIDIGGNDGQAALRADRQGRAAAIQTLERNLDTILDQLIDATTTRLGTRTADIAIMTYYNPYPGDPGDPGSDAYWAEQLNAAIVRAASARGVAVADVAGAFSGGNVYRYTYIISGDIHANGDGHALIADQFLRALRYQQ